MCCDVIFNKTDFGRPHLEAQKESIMVEMSEASSPILLEQRRAQSDARNQSDTSILSNEDRHLSGNILMSMQAQLLWEIYLVTIILQIIGF